MRRRIPIAMALLLGFVVGVSRADYPVQPISFERVQLSDAFWLPRLRTQRSVLVPFAFERTKPAWEDFQAAAAKRAGKSIGPLPEEVPGHWRYRASDLFKVIEGAAYLLAVERDAALEEQIDRIVASIVAAQEADGYLNPIRTLYPGRNVTMMGDAPYAYVDHSHELYNVGHLYEAAVAYFRATGKRELLDVAERNARHIERVFFRGDPNYHGGRPVQQAPGHEEIELALVKLSEATGERSYQETARRFLEVRGVTHRPDGEGIYSATYAQQHRPVVEQVEPVGHAVRATYLYCGMADVAATLGETPFRRPLEQIWTNLVDTRMHITGGLGAVHGIEGFGAPYFLPNAQAFNETCAAVGNVLFNFRMYLLYGDAKYLDVAELALYNNVLAGVSLSGDRFFYVNPLAADGQTRFNHGHAERAPWFDTACCPTNLARLIPQVPGMLYAADPQGIYLGLYAASRTTATIDGVATEIVQQTEYPYEGRIRLQLTPERPTQFAFRLRIPTWTGDRIVPGTLYRYADTAGAPVEILVNGERVTASLTHGFAVLERQWQAGDVIELNLPMPVRANVCDPQVAANRGCIAVSRGPLVYCAETADNSAPPARYHVTPSDVAGGEERWLDIAGHRAIAVTIPSKLWEAAVDSDAGAPEGDLRPARLTLVPYYVWNNRGAGAMQVWHASDRHALAESDTSTE